MKENKKMFSRIPDNQRKQISDELSSVHIPNLQELDVRLLETHPNIVVLESLAYEESGRRLHTVDKVGFVRWLNKVHRIFRDDLGFDSDSD